MDGQPMWCVVRQPEVCRSLSGGVRWCDAGKRSDGGVPTAASPRSSLACIGPVMTVSSRVSGFRVRRRCDAPPAHVDAVERQLATESPDSWVTLHAKPVATADNRTM